MSHICNIDEFSKSFAIWDTCYLSRSILTLTFSFVDVFDAMTSNRVYRHGICPFQVLTSLESNIECYDPAILLTALERIAGSQIIGFLTMLGT